ncbi:MAG: 8-amino-7-oxononanoate synthase [Candidatus Omnitrophica bacterium]|nr:8-amino-7-oxononanoate synthase [Candidatus Omnitrophota bacterium]
MRTLTTVEAVDGVTATIEGRRLVLWCTNDYLGLSQHPRLIQAASEAARRWGVGARASRLLAGSTALHRQLEERLASFFHAEAAAAFPSGYLANLGILGALLSSDDIVFIDRLAHASLIDACRLSRARLRVFRHNDTGHVSTLLKRTATARPTGGYHRRVVVTEGVFSMEGDRAPLKELLGVTRREGALLYVDDAHGAFATGATGRGTPEVEGLVRHTASADRHEPMIYMATLGKALGCQGGFVAGSSSLIRLIQNRARSFIYETAQSPPVVAAACEALDVIEQEPSHREALARNVERIHQGLRKASDTFTHIVPIVVGTSRRARELSASLFEQGIFAPAIRPPTVPEGTARLRLSVTALHTEEQIDHLAHVLRQAVSRIS